MLSISKVNTDKCHLLLKRFFIILIIVVGIMKIAMPIILFFHGLIHLMGFAIAFRLVEIEQLSGSISKFWGWVWLLTALLFQITFILFILKKDAWPILAIVAAMLSQILILTVWSDAKFGTFINIIILITAINLFMVDLN